MEPANKPAAPTKEQVTTAFDELEAATVALPVAKDASAEAQSNVTKAMNRYESAKKAWQLIASQVGK